MYGGGTTDEESMEKQYESKDYINSDEENAQVRAVKRVKRDPHKKNRTKTKGSKNTTEE